MNITRYLRPNLFGEKPEVTDEVIEYYRKNPGELDLIIDKEYFNIKFLSFFFALGLGTAIGARILIYWFGDAWGPFWKNVVLDVISELGIAIFGGAVTAYFLEFLKNKQYKQNMQFRNEIKARLEAEKE